MEKEEKKINFHIEKKHKTPDWMLDIGCWWWWWPSIILTQTHTHTHSGIKFLKILKNSFLFSLAREVASQMQIYICPTHLSFFLSFVCSFVRSLHSFIHSIEKKFTEYLNERYRYHHHHHHHIFHMFIRCMCLVIRIPKQQQQQFFVYLFWILNWPHSADNNLDYYQIYEE